MSGYADRREHPGFDCSAHTLNILPVYGILIYEWVQTGLITAVAFDNFVYGYGSLTALTAFHNSWFSVTVMSSIASSVVQCFFAWRIYIISRSKLLTGIIVTVRAFLPRSSVDLPIRSSIHPRHELTSSYSFRSRSVR